MTRRSWRTRLIPWAALALAAGMACQLVVGVDDLQDKRCPSGQKECDNRCVLESDTTTGCAGLTCAPCVVLHATAKCGNNGECIIAVCNTGYKDCDLDKDGCETDLAHDPNNCGDCRTPCLKPPNGSAGCSASTCAIGGCDPGWEDCNDRLDDGCETRVSMDDQNCGACLQLCPTGMTCNQGICM